ncbi:hypothetical protein AVEN_214114-1 [Araneus ventricosus]|uniref:Uncharacterized protein n=1 Tax=Araneus ventricosus TaxID=182803 RepID=A0A4Y2C6G7_ARAVE|nr:hypothetical protein AVEN_214114-1 [Araneus ventricosus]
MQILLSPGGIIMVVRLVNGANVDDRTYHPYKGSVYELLLLGLILHRSQYPYSYLLVFGHKDFIGRLTVSAKWFLYKLLLIYPPGAASSSIIRSYSTGCIELVKGLVNGPIADYIRDVPHCEGSRNGGYFQYPAGGTFRHRSGSNSTPTIVIPIMEAITCLLIQQLLIQLLVLAPRIDGYP